MKGNFSANLVTHPALSRVQVISCVLNNFFRDITSSNVCRGANAIFFSRGVYAQRTHIFPDEADFAIRLVRS